MPYLLKKVKYFVNFDAINYPIATVNLNIIALRNL